MRCPECGGETRVYGGYAAADVRIRNRLCVACDHRFRTMGYEQVMDSKPVKRRSKPRVRVDDKTIDLFAELSQ